MSNPAQPDLAAGRTLTVEEQIAENKRVNPEPQVPEPQAAAPAEPSDDLDVNWEPRAEIYNRLDEHNKKANEQPEGWLVNPVLDDDPAQQGDTQAAPSSAAPGEPEAPMVAPTGDQAEVKGPVTLSRAEFLEVFQDFRIKDRVAGEEVEAPVNEWIKATGLERHLTKKIMEVSRKEREVLDRWAKTQETASLSEDKIQQKYDELYQESPYKANQFLKEMEANRQTAQTVPQDENARAAVALSEFQNTYPDVSQEDWNRMNNPAFWKKFPDVIKARDNKEWFPVFVLAYNHLQEEKLEVERQLLRQKQEERNKGTQDAIQRKREGAVLRTTVQPPKKAPEKATVYDRDKSNKEYIESLRQTARARMGIKE